MSTATATVPVLRGPDKTIYAGDAAGAKDAGDYMSAPYAGGFSYANDIREEFYKALNDRPDLHADYVKGFCEGILYHQNIRHGDFAAQAFAGLGADAKQWVPGILKVIPESEDVKKLFSAALNFDKILGVKILLDLAENSPNQIIFTDETAKEFWGAVERASYHSPNDQWGLDEINKKLEDDVSHSPALKALKRNRPGAEPEHVVAPVAPVVEAPVAASVAETAADPAPLNRRIGFTGENASLGKRIKGAFAVLTGRASAEKPPEPPPG